MDKLDVFYERLEKLLKETGFNLELCIYKNALTKEYTDVSLFARHENLANVKELIKLDLRDKNEWRKCLSSKED